MVFVETSMTIIESGLCSRSIGCLLLTRYSTDLVLDAVAIIGGLRHHGVADGQRCHEVPGEHRCGAGRPTLQCGPHVLTWCSNKVALGNTVLIIGVLAVTAEGKGRMEAGSFVARSPT